MLDFFGTVAITTMLAVCLFAFISTMATGQAVRLLLAGLAGIWIGLAAAFGAAGEFADAGRRPVPLVGIMFATPLIAAAVPVAWLAARIATDRDRLIGAWNVFGALDLFVAVGLATVSTPGSPLQIIQTAVGPAAMQQLPWALIPTVLVPYWLVAHGIIFAQLRARRMPRG